MGERCVCGAWINAKTAWTSLNAGRRFISCDRCRYFRWLDAPLCERARIIIPGLLRRINHLESLQSEAEFGRTVVCSNEAAGEGLKVIEDVKPTSNLPLTLLVVTWMAIFLYWFCKTEDVEDM